MGRAVGRGACPRLGDGHGGGVAAIAPDPRTLVLDVQEEVLAAGRCDVHAEAAELGIADGVRLPAGREAVDLRLAETGVGHGSSLGWRLHPGKCGAVPTPRMFAITRKKSIFNSVA